MPDGDETRITFDLSLQGENVTMENLSDMTGSGTFHNGKLTLTLKKDDDTYVLEGQLDHGALSGSWRKQHANDHGTWSATPLDRVSPERHSPALVALNEYHRLSGGGFVYSTSTNAPAGCAPEPRPLCRVWRNPSSTLLLDWKAKP